MAEGQSTVSGPHVAFDPTSPSFPESQAGTASRDGTSDRRAAPEQTGAVGADATRWHRITALATLAVATVAMLTLPFTAYSIYEQGREARLAQLGQDTGKLLTAYDDDQIDDARVVLIAYTEMLAHRKDAPADEAGLRAFITRETENAFRKFVYRSGDEIPESDFDAARMDNLTPVEYFHKVEIATRRVLTYFQDLQLLTNPKHDVVPKEEEAILRDRLRYQSCFLALYWEPVQDGQTRALYGEYEPPRIRNKLLYAWFDRWSNPPSPANAKQSCARIPPPNG